MSARCVRYITAAAPAVAVSIALLGMARGASGKEPATGLALAPFGEANFLSNLTEMEPDEGGWKFRIGFPVWIAGIDGDITVRDRTLSSDVNSEEVVDLLDTNLNVAFAGHVEIEKGRFGMFADALYIDFRGERDTRLGTTIDAQAEAFIGELGAFYTLIAPDAAAEHPFRLDLLGGVRVTAFDVTLDTENFGSADQGRDWFDPFIGARAELGLLEWLAIKGRGDIGGFGISEGDTSDLVWNIEAAVSFKLVRWFEVDLGYRWLDYDYADGSGDDVFELDAILNGPYVTLTFKF